jgi:hypothetical protein
MEIGSDTLDLLEHETLRAARGGRAGLSSGQKWIGAFAAVGGLDTLLFAGGIEENCP